MFYKGAAVYAVLTAGLPSHKNKPPIQNIQNSEIIQVFSCSTEHEIQLLIKSKILNNKDLLQTLRCCIYHAINV